jgi:hypothetical protein
MSLDGTGNTFLPFTISGLTDITTSTSNLGNATATTLNLTSATANKIARFDASKNLVSASVDTTDIVPYTGATTTVNLGSQNITTTRVPLANPDLTNKLYVDTAVSAASILATNNTFTGTNTFNNTVVMGDGYTTNINNAFASLQVPTATATGFATGGTDYPGSAPVSTLVKPSYYQLSSTGGSFGMSMLFDRGYTGASFTAGASTTITGTWQANTVSSRIATITFDVSLYIGKSLRCVWEGVNCPSLLTTPYPNFIVVNGASTVFTSPAPLVGTNTFVWNFTPTVATTTITITLQASGAPSLPALAWTGFSIKQVGAFAYQSGATYKLTLTNIRASSTVYYDIYQYNTGGSLKTYIGSAFSTPITTTGQNISLFFYPNLVPAYTGTIVYEFQAGSPNQYVRFDSALMARADMQIYGTLQNTSLSVAGSFVSNSPSGNSGNGSIVNMTAFNGAYGSIEAYDTANANKLPLALNGYGGNVGIGLINPTQKLQVAGRGCFGYIPSSKRGIFIDNEDAYGTNPCIQGVDAVFGASPISINPAGGNVVIGATVPISMLDVRGTIADGRWATPVLNVYGGTGFDASNIVNFQCQASAYGRNIMYMTGRYEGSNDSWSFASARNAIMFQTQSALNSAATQRFTIQNFATQLGILSNGGGNSPLIVLNDNGNTGINNSAPVAKLDVVGSATINNGSNYANSNGRMGSGSLTIGGTTANYGGGYDWNSSTAGLLFECLDNTEIAVHDAGTRVASFMQYSGAQNTFYMGRLMGTGWGNATYAFSGIVQCSVQPRCRLYGAGGGIAINVGAVWGTGNTLLVGSSAGMSNITGNGWDAANGVFYAPQTGRYQINITLYWNYLVPGNRLLLKFFTSGGTNLGDQYVCIEGGGIGSDSIRQYSTMLLMPAGSYFYVYMASGGNGSASYFAGYEHSQMSIYMVH